MTLAPHEFIRRFLLHVLPRGFHRIRHYGLLANGGRAENIARAGELLGVSPAAEANAAGTAEKADAEGPTRPAAAMPMLRRAYDRHRGLRPRFHAQIPAARRGARLGRYVMMPLSPFPNRSARDCRRAWSVLAGARLKKHRGCTKPFVFQPGSQTSRHRTAHAASPAPLKLPLAPVLPPCTATGVLIKSP